MPDPNVTLPQLFSADEASRQLLQHVVESIMLDSGSNFADTLERVYEAADWARDSGDETLGGLLKSLGGNTHADVLESVKLLEQRDATVQTAAQPPSKTARLKRDSFGRVLLDQSYKGRPKAVGADGQVLDDQEFEDRLSRARKLDASYAGDEGRRQFRLDDAIWLGAGVDMVKTFEVGRQEQAAHAEAGQVARQLDQAIAAGIERRSQARKLDEQIGGLTDRRRELTVPTADDAHALKLLDQAGTKRKSLSTDAGARRIEKRARKRLRRLGLPDTSQNYIMALEAEGRGDAMPKKQAPSGPAAAPTPGVTQISHAIHEQVTERMKLLDCSYQDALEQILGLSR